MADDADDTRLARWEMLASALAGRDVALAPVEPGEPPWTDGATVFLDSSADARDQRNAIAAQASLIAAGSLASDVVEMLVRHPRLAKRYLAVEGHRALLANATLLPGHLGPPPA